MSGVFVLCFVCMHKKKKENNCKLLKIIIKILMKKERKE